MRAGLRRASCAATVGGAAARRVEHDDVGAGEPVAPEEAVGGARPRSGRSRGRRRRRSPRRRRRRRRRGRRPRRTRATRASGRLRLPAPQKRSSTRAPGPTTSTTVRTSRRLAAGFTCVKLPESLRRRAARPASDVTGARVSPKRRDQSRPRTPTPGDAGVAREPRPHDARRRASRKRPRARGVHDDRRRGRCSRARRRRAWSRASASKARSGASERRERGLGDQAVLDRDQLVRAWRGDSRARRRGRVCSRMRWR